MNFASTDAMTSMLGTLAHNTNSGRQMKIKITERSMKHKDSGFAQIAVLLHTEYLAAIESFVLYVKKVTATHAIFLQTLKQKFMRI